MKQDIHPEYKKMKIKCVCGNEIETGSIEENITVEICNKCHPFYTGNQKIMDTEGRVERFKKDTKTNSFSYLKRFQKSSKKSSFFIAVCVKKQTPKIFRGLFF